MSVCVCIVTYNSQNVIAQTLESLRFLAQPQWLGSHLVVVDNQSSDSTVDVVTAFAADNPGMPVALVAAAHNGGWGAGNNLGLAQAADATYFLFLNPDCRIDEASLQMMSDFLDMASETVAGVIPSIRNRADRLVSLRPNKGPASMFVWDIFAKSVFDRRVDRRYGDIIEPTELPADVYASGACLLVRTHLLRSVGGLDERIFLYNDDVDLCFRLRDSGYALWLIPQAVAVHMTGTGASIVNEDVLSTRRKTMFYESELVYASKRFGPTYSAALAAWRYSLGLPLLNLRRRIRGHPPLTLHTVRRPAAEHLRLYVGHREDLPEKWHPRSRD